MNTSSLKQLSETGSLGTILKPRIQKLNAMSRFKEIKVINRKLTQKQISIKLTSSDSTLKRCSNDIKMQSLQRFPPTNHKINETK